MATASSSQPAPRGPSLAPSAQAAAPEAATAKKAGRAKNSAPPHDTTDAAVATQADSANLLLSPPGALGNAVRPVPLHPRLAQIDSLLFRTDSSQRPWGVCVVPACNERFVFMAPQDVGQGAEVEVRGQAVVAWGLSLGPRLVLSAVGITVLLLPVAAIGLIPKGVLAAASALALGLGPRGSFNRHRLVACTTFCTPAELRLLAAYRNSWPQRLLAAAGLDGLRPWPVPLRQAASASLPQVGNAQTLERAQSMEGGLGISAGLGLLPGSLVRHSWLRHNSRARSLESVRISPETLRLQLSQVVSQPWRAELTEGLLWGTQHRGAGRQVVRVHTLDVVPGSVEAAQANALFAAAMAGVAALPIDLATTDISQVETVASQGAGWRWPWSLPYFKSFGVGSYCQRYAVQQRGGHGGAGLSALGVVGMNESPRGGRVNWELRVSWQNPTVTVRVVAPGESVPPTPPVASSPWTLSLAVYVPWLSQGRQQELAHAFGGQLFAAATAWPTGAGSWRQDLQVSLETQVDEIALRQAADAAKTAVGPHTAWHHAGAQALTLLTELRHALGLPEHQAAAAGNNDGILHLLAQAGLGAFGALAAAQASAPASANAGVAPPRVVTSYGQTQRLLQDAAWHLSAWPEAVGKAPWRWRPQARKLVTQLDQELVALAACPFTRAMDPSLQRHPRRALMKLKRRLQASLGEQAGGAGATPAAVAGVGRSPAALPALLQVVVAVPGPLHGHTQRATAEAPRATSVLHWARQRDLASGAPVPGERDPLLAPPAPPRRYRPFYPGHGADPLASSEARADSPPC